MAGAAGPNLSALGGGSDSAGPGNGAMSAGAQIAGTAGVSPTVSGGGTVAAFIDVESGRPDFQKNGVEVVKKSPELIKLLQEHNAARQRYDALYREMHGPAETKAE